MNARVDIRVDLSTQMNRQRGQIDGNLCAKVAHANPCVTKISVLFIYWTNSWFKNVKVPSQRLHKNKTYLGVSSFSSSLKTELSPNNVSSFLSEKFTSKVSNCFDLSFFFLFFFCFPVV